MHGQKNIKNICKPFSYGAVLVQNAHNFFDF